MWRDLFILVHTVTASLALVAGVVALWRAVPAIDVHLWSLVGMEVFLVLAVAADWGGLDAVSRVLFAALSLLGAAMVWVAVAARRCAPARGERPARHYVERVCFNLVALIDAFAVITVLEAGAPGWALVVTGVGVAVAGHVALRATRSALAG